MNFEGSYEFITTHWLDQTILFKLKQKREFDTYYKPSTGASILVFEVKIKNDVVVFNSYSPILLFGNWTFKLPFRRHPIMIFKYLKEGYQISEKLQRKFNCII